MPCAPQLLFEQSCALYNVPWFRSVGPEGTPNRSFGRLSFECLDYNLNHGETSILSMTDQDLTISVVVDNHPRFYCEFVLWALCATESLDIEKRVYFVSSRPSSLIRFAKRQNIEVRFADSLIPESPHCNKFIPFLDPNGSRHRIVSDTDLFFCRDISLFFDRERIRLPPNNHACPPIGLFEKLFSKAELGIRPEPGLSLFKGSSTRETYSGNVSAGLIFVPESLRNTVTEWLDCAHWLVKNRNLLGAYAGHVDQISVAMTAARSDFPFKFLAPQTNAILQLLPEIDTVFGVHLTSGHIPNFSKWFAGDGTLIWREINHRLQDDIEWINEKILEAKTLISHWPETTDFATNFLNPTWKR